MQDDFSHVRATAQQKARPDKKLLVLLVCLFVAVAVAIGAVAGAIGYRSGRQNGRVSVLRTQDGATIAKLSADGTRTVTDVVDAVADTVVEIECTVKEIVQSPWGQLERTSTSAGSGVIVDGENGYIITNNHVIENATNILIRTRGGEEYAATLVGTDANNDIAVLHTQKSGLPSAVFGSSASLKVGQTVVVIGNPLGTLGGTVTDGILSALGRTIQVEGVAMTLLQTNAAINSGNSGGGMFDLDGRLIGIVNAKSTGDDVEGLGFAIPADTALSVYEQILQNA